MKALSRFSSMMFAALLALSSTGALAHSALTASLPGDGVVVAAPEKLELTFNEDVRALRVTLVHGERHQIDFGFTPNTSAQSTLSYELPALMNGAHTVDWTVIGTDGHTVNGSFGFTVSPDGEVATAQEHDHHHHH